jgi:predicted NAD/FAD-binding protein
LVGNNPARPDSEKTVGCYNHPLFDAESHRMIRLSYRSTAEKRLRNYIKGGD